MRYCPVLFMLVNPVMPKKKTMLVWTRRYSDSNPMIEGVMIRLLVMVWKATVASAWHQATTRITATDVARTWAIRQKPGESTGMGLRQARMQ